MRKAVIAATGTYLPVDRIDNEELIYTFNIYVDRFNAEHAEEIASGKLAPLQHSSPEFIEKASGIRARHVIDKAGILDPEIMHPRLSERRDEELSVLAEIAIAAARPAIARWGKPASAID